MRLSPIACGFVALAALGATAPARLARAEGTAPEARAAERTLRSAELRDNDETAMELYRRASRQAAAVLSREPDSPDANFVYFAATGRVLLADGLARNLVALRRLDRDHLDRAIALDPNHADALAAKGGILLDLPVLIGGDPAEGLRLLRRATELNPGGAGTRVTYAKALARNGDVVAARREARIAAHRACRVGKRKTLDHALALLGQLGGDVVRAGFR